ncbi:MAG: glycogen synthase GlgA [Ignavibacteria bacterium]|nr:glycogen synthase GlgA [Ignavibacteria bacterium]
MAKPLNVLFLSSEVDPFAKTGGLADVSGALPQSIKELNHEIRIIMPCYGSINERKSKLHNMTRLREIKVPVGAKSMLANVKSSFISNNHIKVQVYFLDNPALFGRSGLYVHPETMKDYPDNDERFIFFSRGVLEVLKKMGWQPDIIHCNDWQTGLVPAYLKTIYKRDPFYKNIRTVFTIHNMAYQGVFPKSSFSKTSLPPELFSEEGLEAENNMNLLKSGLVFADTITTVSEKYAEEIRSSEEYGFGLQDVVNKRKNDLTGIINGIDYSVWNPSVDEFIPRKYDFKSIELKRENKKALLAKMGLTFDQKIPVLGIISRLADQKGFDLIREVIDEIMKLRLHFVILGTGEKPYHKMFESAAKAYPENIAVDLSFNNALAHLIEAGSDMFLMPSRYEPCGLNQLYSLKYGTVPIVRATGGLDDTIQEFNPTTGTGTGFKFKKYDSREMLQAIQRAVQMYNDPHNWKKIIKNGMAKDFSWESSAKKYLRLYRSITKK